MPAHKQVRQSIKRKHKGPNIPKGKSCMKMPTALGPQTWLLQVSSWRFMVCEYFQFLACPREEIFSMALALPPHLILPQSKSSPGQGSPPVLILMAIKVSQDIGTPRDSREWENHSRLWNFTQKTRPLATSDQLIVLTFLKVRNEDAFFQSRTVSINLWQIGVSDPQYPAEELVILFVQAPQEKGNGSQHHQCHKNSQSYKPTIWCFCRGFCCISTCIHFTYKTPFFSAWR